MPLLVQGTTVVVGMALGLLAARLLIAGVLAATFGRGHDRAGGAFAGSVLAVESSVAGRGSTRVALTREA